MDHSPTHRSDGDVRVLQDAAAAMRSLHKDSDAQWVAGLEDEDYEAPMHQRQSGSARHQKGQRGSGDIKPTIAAHPTWLRWPKLLGTLWVISLVWRLTIPDVNRVRQAEFPPYEFHLWNNIKGALLTSSIWADLVLPSIGVTTLGAMFSLATTFQFGAVTQDFWCFCGFGLSALSLFSSLSSGAVLLAGCASADAAIECFTPVVSTWLSSAFRWLFPLIALWPVAQLWDRLRAQKHPGRGRISNVAFRVVAALPIASYAIAFGCTKWVCYRTDTTLCGDSGPGAVSIVELLSDPFALAHQHYGTIETLLNTAEVFTAIVASLVVVQLWSQKPLALVQVGSPVAQDYPALMPPSKGGKEKKE